MKKQKMSNGFTLIELMIVVAIIGILAAIAIPQFASLVAKSQEGRTKANLGTIRSALSIYYGDMEGWYPNGATNTNLAALASNAKYLQNVPNADLPRTVADIGHTSTSTEEAFLAAGGDDASGWAYDNDQSKVTWGRVAVNCTHNDLKGNIWSVF